MGQVRSKNDAVLPHDSSKVSTIQILSYATRTT